MKFFPKSLRLRIQLWHTLLLAVIVSALLFAFYSHQKEIAVQKLDRKLTSAIPTLLPRLDGRANLPPKNRGPRPERGPGPKDDFFGDDDFFEEPGPPPHRHHPLEDQKAELDKIVTGLVEKDIFIIAWNPRGDLRYRSLNIPVDHSPKPNSNADSSQEVLKRTVGQYREALHTDPNGAQLLIGTSYTPTNAYLSALALKLAGIASLLVAGGFLVGSILIRRSLKPIQGISDTAHDIADGNLSKRISTSENVSELGKLSHVLNDTFEKLESSFEHQVRFTADASHEMRTPISVILAKSQFALSKERSPEKYQEALQTCMDSAQHMRELTDNLLALSKVDSGEFQLKKDSHDFGQLIREVVEMITPLAEKRSLKITSSLPSLQANFDSQRIRQVLLNLLSNAVKYNRENGEIHLKLTQEEGNLNLTIRDTGPGIEAESLPHIFERFYRINQARTHGKATGTGLGLAITHAIVTAHGGKISAHSTLREGSTFTITLPCV